MTEILTFDEALQLTDNSRRYLLLGNGFSIACDPTIFNYESLYIEASERIKDEMPEVSALFEQLGTKDFEAIIRMLLNTRAVLPVYLPNDAHTPSKLEDHAQQLKEILITTIAENHPEYPGSIPLEKFAACRSFLANFVRSDAKGKVYTLNYDLLLYWALMNTDADGENPISLNANDGFGRNEPDDDYVVWINEAHSSDQRIYYLHGALHLYDNGAELEKFTWINTGIRLVNQAREALSHDKFPLFVAEGESASKLEKIRHHPYLHHGYKSFLQTLKQRGGSDNKKSLFIYGHSLSESDDHIITKIGKGSISNLFVSIYGDPGSDRNKKIIQKAKGLASLRDVRHPLNVYFYDAQSAQVWG